MTSVESPKSPRRRVLSDLAAARAVSLPVPAESSRSIAGAEGLASGTAALSGQLANLPLFTDLDPATLHALIQQARPIDLEAGKVLFHQGDASKSLFIVVDGAVVPIAEGGSRRKLAVLERGALVGEIGLVTRQPRNATVAALVDSRLLALDRSALMPAMRSQPALAEGILRPARQRMLDRQIRTNLFFAAFAPPDRSAVARRFRLVEVKAGSRIVEQGKPPEGLFVVLAGSFARIDRRSGRELATIGIGELCGGDALLDGRPSDHDVVANGKAWVLVLGERRFRHLLEEHPRLVRVVQKLSGRVGRSLPPAVDAKGKGPDSRATATATDTAASPGASPRPPASHPSAGPASRPTSRSASGSASPPKAGSRGASGDRARRSRS